jgi:hypothetical protein
MAYSLLNRSDLAMKINTETGEAWVLVETQRTEGDTEITEYVWALVKEG